MKPQFLSLSNGHPPLNGRMTQKNSTSILFLQAMHLAARHKSITRLFGFFATLMLTMQVFAASYTVNLAGSGSFNPIANHLNNPAGNDLNTLFPGASEGDQIFYWDCANEDFDPTIPTYSAFTGGWFPNLTLNPGQGVMYVNQGAPRTVTFSGNPVTASLPPTLPCGCGHRVMLSSQTAAIASWESLMGASPTDGSQFITFDVVMFDWVTNTFSNCVWSRGTPSANVGESVWLNVSCSTNQCTNATLAFICSQDKTRPIGSSWSFDPPGGIYSPCGTNVSVSVLSTVTNGDCPQNITRTWLIEDACGNSNTCSQTVMIVDVVPPVIDCAALQALAAGTVDCQGIIPNLCLSNYFSDADCGISNIVQNPVAGTIVGPGLHSITITATDNSGNSSQCVVAFSVGTVSSVVVVRTGTDVSGNLLPTGAPEQNFINIASPVGISPMVTVNPGSSAWVGANGISKWVAPSQSATGPVGWYTNRWTFYLPCPNATLKGRIATDDEGYLFLNGVDISPVGGYGFHGFGPVSQSKGFVPGWNTLDIVVHEGGTVTGFRAELTNYVFNCCCTNPVTVICPTNKTLPCGTAWNFDAPLITEVGGGMNYTAIFTTTTNGPCPYAQYIRNWIITDACGNTNFCSQTVTVTNPAPLLGCATNKTVQCGSAWSFDPPTVLNGSCSNTTTVLNTVTNGICPKNVTRMWLVSNPCGFSNFCSQTVSIIDNTPPIATYPTNKTVICGAAWNFDAPTATDDCNGTNVSITVVSTVTNGICPKVITRLWKLTDQCGNFTTRFQQITVSYASLVLNCTTNKTVPCGSAWAFDAPVLANSSCGTLSILTTYTNGTDCSKAISRIWVATNTCGAYITCTQTVAVVDTIAPSLCCPNDMTFTTCSNSVVVNFKVKVTDNCSSGLVATCNPASGSSFPAGTTTVSCTATDACGNVGTCSFKVTVKAGVLKWQTVSLGKLDCFKNGSDYFKNGVDNTPRSLALKSLGVMQGFDGNAISATKFGASFMGLSNAINCATLEIWMRPNSFGSNYPALDTISLGLTNYPATPKFAWTNFIGNTDEPGSILHYDWVSAPNCGTKITLDLASLPNGGGSLLPVINQTHRLDMLVKALTEVDYARLCYCYCASKQVWKRLEWDMSNATMYRACDDVIFVKRSGLGALRFGTAVGQTYGVGLGFEPIGFASTVDGLTFKAQRVSGASPNHVTVSGDGAGGLEFRSANVRSNVTHLEVTLYNGDTTVSQSTLVWSPTALIANTDAGAKIVRASVTDAGDRQLFKLAGPVLMGNNSNAPVVADSIAIKFVGVADVPSDLVEGYFFDTEMDAEIVLNDANVLTGDLETRVSGDAVTSVSGDVTTITASEMLTNNPVGFTIPVSSQLPPLVINPAFNACRYWITDGILNGTLSGIGNATFTLVTNVWKVDCSFPPLNPSGVRWQVLSSGTVVADTGVTPVTSASVTSLPNQWRFSNIAVEGVFRLNWSDLTLFTINGNDIVGDELRLIPLGGAPIPNLTTFSVTSQGIESLTLTAPSAPAQWIMLPLQLTGNQVNVQWTGPGGGVLESAPTVLGPWATVPNQTDLSTIVPRTAAPAEFFRVRSN